MRKYRSLAAAVIALIFLAVAPDCANAQVGTGTIYTSPVDSPTYSSPSAYYAPIYYSVPVSRTIYTPRDTTPRSYITPIYRTYTPPSSAITFSADGTAYATNSNRYIQSYHTFSLANNDVSWRSGAIYLDPNSGNYYRAPTFNPAAVYGGFVSNYPSSYAPYRSFWFGVSRYRAWSPNR
jgi:hypothetical protein